MSRLATATTAVFWLAVLTAAAFCIWQIHALAALFRYAADPDPLISLAAKKAILLILLLICLIAPKRKTINQKQPNPYRNGRK